MQDASGRCCYSSAVFRKVQAKKISLIVAGKEYVLAAYNTKEKTFEKVERNAKMPKSIGNDLMMQMAASLRKTAAAAEVTDAPATELQAAIAASAPKAVAETAAVEKKRRQRKVNAGLKFDYAKAIEYLSQALPETVSVSDAAAEVRSIRDLLIAGARRSANLTTALSDAAKRAEELKDVLKKFKF